MQINEFNHIVTSLGAMAMFLPSSKFFAVCFVLAPLAISVLLNTISQFS